MPMLSISTNVQESAIPPEFVSELSSLVTRLCGKPEKFINILVDHGKLMSFAGTPDPCASCHFCCLGKLGEEENKKYTAAFMEFINRKLKIPVDRIYIIFVDPGRENFGWNGTTFA